MNSGQINIEKVSKGAAAAVLLLVLGGCAAGPQDATAKLRTQEPSWTKVHVAGSRIARRVDAFGNPATGTMVQVISDSDLQRMPGTSLGDKLSGNPGI